MRRTQGEAPALLPRDAPFLPRQSQTRRAPPLAYSPQRGRGCTLAMSCCCNSLGERRHGRTSPSGHTRGPAYRFRRQSAQAGGHRAASPARCRALRLWRGPVAVRSRSAPATHLHDHVACGARERALTGPCTPRIASAGPGLWHRLWPPCSRTATRATFQIHVVCVCGLHQRLPQRRPDGLLRLVLLVVEGD
jgi:hypothetical protein